MGPSKRACFPKEIFEGIFIYFPFLPLTTTPEMRNRFCAFLVIATSFFCSFANSTPEDPEFVEKEPFLTVGAVDDSLPCSVKVDGVFKGFPIEVWRHVAEKNDLNYSFQSISSYDKAIKLASQNAVDLVVSCHSVTPSRLKIVDFSVPFQRSSIVLVSKNNNKVGFKFFLKILQNEVFWKCSIFLVLMTTFASIAITKGGFNINKILKNWMYLMLGSLTPIIDDKKENYPFLLLAGLSRVAFLSLIVGTVASLVYAESKPIDSRVAGRSFLRNALSEGVVVIDETSSKAWLMDLMAKRNIDKSSLQPISVKTNGEKRNYLKSSKALHFVDDSLTYKSVLKDAGLTSEFSPTIRSMNVYPQSFVFSPKLPKKIRRMINIEIANMSQSGMLVEMINYWDYESPYVNN